MIIEHVHKFPQIFVSRYENKQKLLFTKTKGVKTYHIDESDSFHNAIGPVIFFIQIFAIFPVKSIFDPDPTKLHFKLFSIQTLSCVLLIVENSIEYGLLFHLVPITGIQTMGYVIFYGVAIGASLKFIHLAHKWNELVCFIYQCERKFVRYPYEKVNRISLRTKIRFIGFTMLILAGIEHGLLIVSDTVLIKLKLDRCENLTIPDLGKYYIDSTRDFWYIIWDYHPMQIVVFVYSNYAITYSWNFIDVMVMIMSVNVAYRYEQIYGRVKMARGRGMATFLYPLNFWKEIRVSYLEVTRMLKKVNEEISFLTTLSLGNCIYFICLQFYNSSFDRLFWAATLYFWFSIIFLIARTITTILCASMVNRASVKLLPLMKLIPPKEWDCEAQRLYDHIRTENIGMSGKNYFIVTRKVMLVMASYILTYELYFMEDYIEHEEFVTKYCPK